MQKYRRKKISKVMLVTPPGKIAITSQGSRERKLAVPPLGIAYLAASLRQIGVEVQVLDVLIEGYETEQQLQPNEVTYGLTEEEIRKRLRDFNPDMVGVSCLFSNRGKEALNLCRLAREELPESYVVLGGQHPSGYPAIVNDPNVDLIMFGEADLAVQELIEAINSGTELREVSQIILKDPVSGFWKSGKSRLPGVHGLPQPAWDYVNLPKYWNAGLADYEIHEGEKRFMVMISSRGCPHDCNFCTAPMMTDRKYRQREIPDVIKEIESYVTKYGIKEVNFWDDNFFINTKRVKKLLAAVTEAFPGMSFQVPSGTEINAVDDETIELMAKAGFKKLFMAVESANEEIQMTQVDKKVKLHRISSLVEKLRSVGIISEGSFMVGFPGETKAQIDNTFKRAQEFGFDRISISIVNPLPGTDLYDEVIEKGLLHDDFDPQNVRWSMENIKMPEVERGYIQKQRRVVWLNYMQEKIDVEKYEKQNLSTDWAPPQF